MAPIVTSEEDDVSSYGVDEDRLLSQQKVDADTGGNDEPVDADPIPYRNPRSGRRTFFADEAPGASVPPRQLPSKSPRSRNLNTIRRSPAKKSPTRTGGRAAAIRENRHEESEADDDSQTQDPTASVHQYGGASNTPVSSEQRRRRESVPSCDRGEEGSAQRSLASRSHSPGSSDNSRKKRRRNNRSTETDNLWEDPADDHPAKRRTYMDWTVDETRAVKEGYETFGKKWAMIKQNCRNRLSRRTNVQIKDKWRTMVKTGEIMEQRRDVV